MAGAGMFRRQRRKRKRIQFGWSMSRWIPAMPKQFSPDQSVFGERRTQGNRGRRYRLFSTVVRFLSLKWRRATRIAFRWEREEGDCFAVVGEEGRGAHTGQGRHWQVMRLRQAPPR